MKAIKFIFLFSIITVLFVGCQTPGTVDDNSVSSNTGKGEKHRGDSFVEASISDAVMINPLITVDDASGGLESDIYPGLLKYDPYYKLVGDLADTWEIITDKKVVFVNVDESVNECKEIIEKLEKEFSGITKTSICPQRDKKKCSMIELDFATEFPQESLENIKKLDKNIKRANYLTTIRFYLRKDVKWTDGKQFTAHDVEFTYNAIMDPEVKSHRRSDFNMIKEVRVPSRFVFEADYFIPFAPALESWGIGIIPKHIFQNENIRDSKYNRAPVGTGPYMLEKWVSDEYILLKANPDYYAGEPYITRKLIKIIPDKSQQFIELKNGGIDYMGLTPDQYKKQIDDAEFNQRFNIFRLPNSTSYLYIGYQCGKEPFNNKIFRRALSYAVDVDAMIDGVYYGAARRITGPFAVSSWAYNPTAPEFEYSPEKSKENLEKAGFKDIDGDGFREYKGKPFEIELMTNNGNKTREYIITVVKDYWEKVGIKTKLRYEEWGQFLNLQDQGKFDAVVLSWGLAIDPDIFGIWHSSKIPNEKYPSQNNFVRYKNEEVDELLEKARFTLDQSKRKDYYWRIHELIAEDQPYTFLMTSDSYILLDKRFKGINIINESLFHNFEQWWVPADEVKYK